MEGFASLAQFVYGVFLPDSCIFDSGEPVHYLQNTRTKWLKLHSHSPCASHRLPSLQRGRNLKAVQDYPAAVSLWQPALGLRARGGVCRGSAGRGGNLGVCGEGQDGPSSQGRAGLDSKSSGAPAY